MRGSITIFATMLLMLVSQFLFTVLEAGRNLTLTNIACMNSEAVAESVFAQYCRPLWDEYHLLAYDAGSVYKNEFGRNGVHFVPSRHIMK